MGLIFITVTSVIFSRYLSFTLTQLNDKGVGNIYPIQIWFTQLKK